MKYIVYCIPIQHILEKTHIKRFDLTLNLDLFPYDTKNQRIQNTKMEFFHKRLLYRLSFWWGKWWKLPFSWHRTRKKNNAISISLGFSQRVWILFIITTKLNLNRPLTINKFLNFLSPSLSLFLFDFFLCEQIFILQGQ